jgi:hypothetical protein
VAVVPDATTVMLILAETRGTRLTAFDIATDGGSGPTSAAEVSSSTKPPKRLLLRQSTPIARD